MVVYPRWRGEHNLCAEFWVPANGLSPLERGTPARVIPPGANARFIPAGAGNTTLSIGRITPIAVYPRWRGELGGWFPVIRESYGLSPLARGTLTNWITTGKSCRFIPAGAGNSSPSLFAPFQRPVYPRWRGELSDIWLDARGIYGLSPLARGTLIAGGSFDCLTRFIPASAGNSRYENRHWHH